MLVYAVIAPGPSPQLALAVKRAFPDNHFEIAQGQFLVADEAATTKEVGDRLNEPQGGVGRFFVTPVSNYSGWHSRDLWEWIAARQAAGSPGQRLLRG